MSGSSVKKSAITIIECPPPLLTVNGKRRGRKPGANSTLAQRSAANSRERSRMRVLSSAFIDLKGALPWVPKDTKLSKLDTLKLAAGYIAYLKSILVEDITGSGVHLPPPWSVYDIYSPHTSSKCSISRAWSPNQSSSQLHQNCQSELKMNYSINDNSISNNNLFPELIDIDSTNQTDRFNQNQFYYRNHNKNSYFL